MIAAKRHRLFGKAFMTALMVLALLGIGTGTGHAEDIVPNTGRYEKQSGEETAAFEPFIRIDRDDPMAYEKDLANLRIITEGAYELGKPKEKYGIDPEYVPDLTGLDTLNASASAQFNEWQFRRLADTLRTEAEGKEGRIPMSPQKISVSDMPCLGHLICSRQKLQMIIRFRFIRKR